MFFTKYIVLKYIRYLTCKKNVYSYIWMHIYTVLQIKGITSDIRIFNYFIFILYEISHLVIRHCVMRGRKMEANACNHQASILRLKSKITNEMQNKDKNIISQRNKGLVSSGRSTMSFTSGFEVTFTLRLHLAEELRVKILAQGPWSGSMVALWVELITFQSKVHHWATTAPWPIKVLLPSAPLSYTCPSAPLSYHFPCAPIKLPLPQWCFKLPLHQYSTELLLPKSPFKLPVPH